MNADFKWTEKRYYNTVRKILLSLKLKAAVLRSTLKEINTPFGPLVNIFQM